MKTNAEIAKEIGDLIGFPGMKTRIEPVLPDIINMVLEHNRAKGEYEKAEELAYRAKKSWGEAMIIIYHGLPVNHNYRKGDPVTSKISARRMQGFRPSHCSRLLAYIHNNGPCTVRTAANGTGISPYAASKRVSDLKNMGLVVGTGETVETDAGGRAELYASNIEEDTFA